MKENGNEKQSVGRNRKSKASALTSESFAGFIEKNDIEEFYITGADATACVKSTSYNLVKAGYKVHVISDCVTSYDLKKLDEKFAYYAGKGCDVKKLGEYTDEINEILAEKEPFDVQLEYIL